MIKLIRVESDNEVSHFSARYYEVKHCEKKGCDELIRKLDNKVLATVSAISLSDDIIVYKKLYN
jgi:hypothetical protein